MRTMLPETLDSDDDFHSGCRSISHCHRQQSFSGLPSPGRSHYTMDCYSQVETIFYILAFLLVALQAENAKQSTAPATPVMVISLRLMFVAYFMKRMKLFHLQIKRVMQRQGRCSLQFPAFKELFKKSRTPSS